MDLFDRIAAAIEAKNSGDTSALTAHVAEIDAHLSKLDSTGVDEGTRLSNIETGLQKIADSVNPPAPPALALSTTALPNATVGAVYTASLAITGGKAPYTVKASPTSDNGITINADGSVSGTATAAATSSFSVTVNDSSTPPASVSGGVTLTAV